MNQNERERAIYADIAADRQPSRGPDQTRSILPSELPAWALKLFIVTAFVLWLTW